MFYLRNLYTTHAHQDFIFFCKFSVVDFISVICWPKTRMRLHCHSTSVATRFSTIYGMTFTTTASLWENPSPCTHRVLQCAELTLNLYYLKPENQMVGTPQLSLTIVVRALGLFIQMFESRGYFIQVTLLGFWLVMVVFSQQ